MTTYVDINIYTNMDNNVGNVTKFQQLTARAKVIDASYHNEPSLRDTIRNASAE